MEREAVEDRAAASCGHRDALGTSAEPHRELHGIGPLAVERIGLVNDPPVWIWS